MPPLTETSWQTMTRVLSELRTPWNFVTQLLFSQFNTNPTETIAIDTEVGGRKMAPFVTPGAEALLIPGMSIQRASVTAPNIRAKRPFTARQLMTKRSAGDMFYVDGSQVRSSVARKVARDLQYAREQIDMTLEWMCAQALTGSLTYNISTADGQLGDAFTIDYGRPAGHTVALTGNDTWDTPKASATSLPREHFITVKELISDKIGVPVTDCVMGSDAADAFLANDSIREDLDNRRIEPGILTLVNQFERTGALYLGMVYGVRCWRYNRQCEDPFGNTVNLVGADKAHFVAAVPEADNIIEYGQIDDLDALEAGASESRFFSKSWREKDPSADMYLWQSRPLPVMRRPESTFTYTVV